MKILLILLTMLATITMHAETSDEKVYIAYMGSLSDSNIASSSHHVDMVRQVKGSSKAAADSLVYSYHKSFNAFAAKLTVDEMRNLSGKEGVISVFESKANMVQTTRSWDFLGFPTSVERSTSESDVIVGLIDSGIWPESESFKDDNFGPPPPKWKGICQGGDNFTCNNKVIGARYYRLYGSINKTDFISPRDSEGHGTHTASIVAGAVVDDASFYGLGVGSARGGVPSARIAIYKACWRGLVCFDADLLAAFDDAIADGVDIISASVSPSFQKYYYQDSIAIGSFHARRKGILTSLAAGNQGPEFGSVHNFAPWALSVAATTIDRKFFTTVKLGDGESLQGFSANTFDNEGHMSELVQLSCPASLEANTSVQGKIVFCQYDAKYKNNNGSVVPQIDIETILLQKGASGALFPGLDRDEAQKAIQAVPFPEATLSARDTNQTLFYINSTSQPTAVILKTSQGNDSTAPVVADFSSRGPSPSNLNILKPDIAAPGVNILAAWSPAQPLTTAQGDDRRVLFNIDSGTSMACPHVSAIAAYIKSFHPTWSPSAITSALLTTALPMNPKASTGAEFAYGAGYINPVSSIDPGLVYENTVDDFIDVLCNSEDYTTQYLQLITGDNTTCTNSNFSKSVWDLNIPSFTVYSANRSVSAYFNRVVTNVGNPGSTYKARIAEPDGFFIRVEPQELHFQSLGESQSFKMFVDGNLTNPLTSTSLIWSDGIHQVRSPVVIHSINNVTTN